MRDSPIPWVRGFLPAAALVVASQLVLVALSGWPAATGEFWGPDSYMRLARTLACEGGSACPGGVFTDTNAPFGEVIHWPFLQDRLLLAMAAPFALVIGWRDAVLVAASLFGPLLAIGSVGLILLAGRSLLEPPALYLVGVLLAFQPWFFQAFAAPQVDHHGLQGFLFLGTVAAALRVLTDPGARRWASTTGVFLGLALWVSTEALVSGLPVLLGLAVFWIAKGGRRAARANRDVTLAVVAVLSVGLLVDAPAGEPLAAQYDRFSFVHWTVFALMSLFWWGAEHLDRTRETRWGTRLWFGCAGAVMWAAAVAMIFPDFFRGPMVDMDTRLAPIWLALTSEFVPVLSQGRPLVVALHLASSSLAIPAAIACAVWGEPSRRAGWRFLLGTLLWFAGLTVFLHGRWGLYLQLMVPIPLAWLLGRVVTSAARIPHPLLAASVRVGAVTVVATAPFLFALPPAVAETRTEGAGTGSSASCGVSGIIPFLQELESRQGPGVILARADWGPEIVFKTGHGAVATPYHRNASGLLDSHAFMSATDEQVPRGIAAARGIDWVIMCRQQPWFPLVEGGDGGTVHARLAADQVPSWLRPVALPEPLARSFRVFAVVEGPQG